MGVDQIHSGGPLVATFQVLDDIICRLIVRVCC